MESWKTAAATLALLSGLAAGAAVAPAAQEQRDRDQEQRDRDNWTGPAVFHMLGGGGRLGVSIRDTSDDDVKRAKLPGVGGVVVEDVREDSAAAKAGFQEGDVIVEFDGERVRGTRQFTRLVQETPTGRPVQAVIVRDGQRTTVSVQTDASDDFSYLTHFDRSGARRMAPRPPSPPPPPPVAFDVFPRLERFFGTSGRLGITVDTLSEQLADYFGTGDGLLVTSVTADSPAAKAGVKAGDVITGINGSKVTSHADLSRRTQRLDDGAEFTLEIVRDKKALTVKGTIEPRQQRRWTTRSIV